MALVLCEEMNKDESLALISPEACDMETKASVDLRMFREKLVTLVDVKKVMPQQIDMPDSSLSLTFKLGLLWGSLQLQLELQCC